MAKELKSVEDWNNERWPHGPTSADGNGIACPACGEEMHDDYPYSVLASLPPKKHVTCRKCLYQTTVLA